MKSHHGVDALLEKTFLYEPKKRGWDQDGGYSVQHTATKQCEREYIPHKLVQYRHVICASRETMSRQCSVHGGTAGVGCVLHT